MDKINYINELTVHDVRLILDIWSDRIMIWNPNTRQCDDVESVSMNGCAIQINLAEDP